MRRRGRDGLDTVDPLPPPRIRLWLAAVVVTGCALAGLGTRCGDSVDIGLAALALAAAIQGASALASLVMVLVACVRGDFGRAGVEAFVCIGMLLVVPLALFALMTSVPECRGPLEGG